MPKFKILCSAGLVLVTAALCACDLLAVPAAEEAPEIVTVTLSTPAVTQKPANISQYPGNKEILFQRIVEEEISIFDMQQDVRDGLYSYADLTRFYLDRIEEYHDLNAIITVIPSAIANAEKCDAENLQSSPLYGIPFIIKDNIDTADTLTTGGAYALSDRRPSSNAFLVSLLVSQGAIPLAKANLDELSGYVIDYYKGSVAHYSALGGAPVSPYGAAFDPGGSSSGSAIAVTMNLAPLAIGTDTHGSILSPACSNSVVGIRPSHALVSRTGIIPANTAYDVAGPMAKSVKEAAYLLYAMQGASTDDPYQQTGAYTPITDPDTFYRRM